MAPCADKVFAPVSDDDCENSEATECKWSALAHEE